MADYYGVNIVNIYQWINGELGGTRIGNGDTLYLDPRNNYTFTSPLNPIRPNYGVRILPSGGTGRINWVVDGIAGCFLVTGSGTQEWYDNPVIISGIDFNYRNASGTIDIAQNAAYTAVQDCSFKAYDITISGTTTKLARDGGGFAACASSGKYVFAELYDSKIYSAGLDCISTKTTDGDKHPTAAMSYLKLYNCYVANCGQKADGTGATSTDQLLTGHNGLPIFAYGCTLENGIAAIGNGPIFLYCCNIRPQVYQSGFVQNTSPATIAAISTYGNVLDGIQGITLNSLDTTSTIAPRGPSQPRLRDIALFRGNYCLHNSGNAAGNYISNGVNGTKVGGHFALIDNIMVQEGTRVPSSASNAWIRVYNGLVHGATSISGIIKNNTILGRADSYGYKLIRTTDELAIGSGYTFLIHNNSFINGTHLIDYFNAWADNNSGCLTDFVNNVLHSGVQLVTGNTFTSKKYGRVYASGNVTQATEPTAFTTSGNYINVNNLWSTIPQMTNNTILYQPVQNGNIDYGSGVKIGNTIDGFGQAVMYSGAIGSRARQVYDAEIFPSIIIT